MLRSCLAAFDAPDQLHDNQQHHRGQQGHKQPGKAEFALAECRRSEKPAQQPLAEHHTGDSSDDVPDDSRSCAVSREYADNPAE